MKGFCESFRKSPMTAFADWQETREPWILFGVTSIILVLLAHYLFQGWLYMLPCEQCVYIRYGNIVMAIGAFLITINPKQALLKIAGIGVFLYGLIYTMICSWKLMGIHDAVHSDDPMAMFGMQGCSTEPTYHFGLPLDKWAPDWFKQATAATTPPSCPTAPSSATSSAGSSRSIRRATAGTSSRSGSSWTWLNAACSPASATRRFSWFFSPPGACAP